MSDITPEMINRAAKALFACMMTNAQASISTVEQEWSAYPDDQTSMFEAYANFILAYALAPPAQPSNGAA